MITAFKVLTFATEKGSLTNQIMLCTTCESVIVNLDVKKIYAGIWNG